MNIRNIQENDIDRIRQFIKLCPPLEVHAAYVYWILSKYFSNSCFIIEEYGEIIGYLSSLISSINCDVLFIWQVGISEKHRGKRYVSILYKHAMIYAKDMRCKRIHMSIDPDNHSAYKGAYDFFFKNNGLSMQKVDSLNLFHTIENKSIFEHIYEFRLD